MKKTILKFGLYAALIVNGIFILQELFFDYRDLSYTANEFIGYGSMVAALTMTYFGIHYFRDNVNEGRLSFLQGLKVGSLISLICGFSFGAFLFLYMEVINTEYMSEFWGYALDEIQNSGLPQEEIYQQLEELKQFEPFAFNGLFQGGLMFVTVVMIGLVISLISSIFLQKS